jgi:general secretion pathway protein F
MPTFAYRGLDGRGKQVSGMRDAESARLLRTLLRREGVFVTDVNEARQPVAHGSGLKREVNLRAMFDRVKPQDVSMMTRQLATLLKAGIPLAEALAALVEQLTSQKFRAALADVRTKVNEGTAFGDALESHRSIFPELYVNMVRAGEIAGSLDVVLARLAEFIEGQVKIRNAISSALVYPIVMCVVGFLITTMLMVVVVPNVTQIFADTGKALPWYTELLIFVSHVMGNYWFILFPALISLVVFFSFWKKSPSGKPTWDRIKLKMWVVGPLTRMIAVGRFARTLGTMLASGVPLLRALEIVKSIVGNAVIVDALEAARVRVREGESLAKELQRSNQFPPVVTRMIAVGERSGQMESMLETVADSYENEVEMRITRLMRLMEPLAILVMGGAVGFIVFSILMPILDMNEMVG